MKTLYVVAVAAMVVVPVSAASTIYLSHLRQEDACDNRQAIVDSFDVYTDALVAASQRTDRTPEEQARVDEATAEFRADIARRLAPLEEGCR